MSNSILNTAEAARRLALASSTLEKMRVYGTGPSFLKLGRAVRYRPLDLDEWLLGRRVASTSQRLPVNDGAR